MESYTSRERRNLLKTTKEIYLYKLMLSKDMNGFYIVTQRPEQPNF